MVHSKTTNQQSKPQTLNHQILTHLTPMDLTEFTNRYKYDPKKDKIGSGGFGDVFKAYDSYLDNYVALKISKVEQEKLRLQKEFKLASSLPDHPNIAKYTDCYTFDMPMIGEHDIGILQYYELGNLEELIFRQSISYETIGKILSQVLNGLEFLHSQNVIHRDMKPKNILMVKRPDGEYAPKITDFGISKKLDADKSLHTHTLTGMGTLSFMSPEQLKEVTIRRNTDLWSFGIIAYQAFTGQLPFRTGDEDASSESGRKELFRQISAGVIPAEVDNIIEPWKSLILKCLVVDPTKRIQSAKECLEILDARYKQTPLVPDTMRSIFNIDGVPEGGKQRSDHSSPVSENIQQPRPYEGDTIVGVSSQHIYKKADIICGLGSERFEGSEQISDHIDTPPVREKEKPEGVPKKPNRIFLITSAIVVATLVLIFLIRFVPQKSNSSPTVPIVETPSATSMPQEHKTETPTPSGRDVGSSDNVGIQPSARERDIATADSHLEYRDFANEQLKLQAEANRIRLMEEENRRREAEEARRRWESENARRDADRRVAEEAIGVMKRDAADALVDINFNYQNAEIRPVDRAKLQKIADFMRKYPDAKVHIEGHCSENEGASEYSLKLGERRTLATRAHLTTLGIDGNRLTTISFGRERPKVTDSNERSYFINRRCEFMLY
ncbi:MAG: protein kinase [Holophagaceae bacterium]|nr:protein kinase [Holophagaceae bacterium]